MPLHLDSLSRRRFLGGTALLVLSRDLSPSRAASGAESWALLSDTHIAANRATVSKQGVNMSENLRRVVAEVLAEKETLAGVIINGDCAYLKGQPGDYATLLELLDPLRNAGLPVHFTLGNHDDREVFLGATGGDEGGQPVAGKHCSVLETPFANWILLDSLRHVNRVEGELGAEQLAWVAAILDAHPDKPAIVMSHHYPQVPPAAPSKDGKTRITGLIDSDAFLESIDARPAAKACIYGHSHHWNLERRESGIHQVNLPPTAYVFGAENPNGWVRATVSAKSLALELRALDRDHPRHGEKHELPWR